MAETPTFGRYAEIPYDKMTPEQQEGYNAMIAARGRLPGPNKIWVHNPKLAKVVGPFGAHFQPGILAQRARARDRRLHHHQQLALGLSDDRARAPRESGRAAGRQGRGDAVRPADRVRRRARAGRLRDGDVLSNARWVPRGLHDRAVKALGHVGVTDVITLMGHYTSVAMTLAFYDVPAGATGMAR